MNASAKAIPSGWYYCADSSELKRGKTLAKELFGTKVVLWRTESGVAHASDATCPHLGSDLSKLGSVRGEHLQCFSHKFEYDGSGNCAKTPRSHPCRGRAVLRTYPVHELSGFVLAYYDSDRREPSWHLPSDLFENDRMGGFVKSQYTFDCSVETINEDNFDVGHLYSFHELTNVRSTLPEIDGHRISVAHDFKRHSILTKATLPPPLHILSREITSRYTSTLYGHGLTDSTISLPMFGFHTQDVIWVTPISTTRTLYTTFLRRALPTGRGLLRDRLVERLIHPILFPAFVVRLRLEHRYEGRGYWENQRRVTQPIITAEERKMLVPYWQWCKQFDPSGAAPRSVVEAS
jgi:phenylpropionate dioxygenase-like ring-hydroxylating dioxygenase large terminal subunit